MFKLFAIVFAAILALASAAPKPGVVAYGAPVVAPAAYSAYSPLAYSAPAVVASPLAYSGQIHPVGYATYY